jgi:hypothetical protein
MEIVLHIGMGKTGTSSIQQALSDNAEGLHGQGRLYMGMWFGLAGRQFLGLAGQHRFFQSDDAAMRAHAERLVARLRILQAETGIGRFVYSNEEFYGQVRKMAPFVSALRGLADVRLVAYARDPREWLPSAYNQWSVFHKNYTGPLRPYNEMARTLVFVYSGFRLWGETFGDILTVRPFFKSLNVVEDFARTLGLTLALPAQRTLERIDPAEGLMRAVYNNRLDGNILPAQFDAALKGVELSKSLGIERLVETAFDYSQTDAVVAEAAPIFAYIKATFGIDLLAGPPPRQATVDAEDLRNRALEHVLQIVMTQADRIRALEQAVGALRAQMAAK